MCVLAECKSHTTETHLPYNENTTLIYLVSKKKKCPFFETMRQRQIYVFTQTEEMFVNFPHFLCFLTIGLSKTKLL